MANKKKLSLQEFYQDSSLGGGSWADDDIDISSISVPIVKQRGHYHDDYLTYSSNSHQTFSSNHNNNGAYPQSPPYIAKFTNIPSDFGVEHIEDLFHSRFMKFQKFKLFWEINHDQLASTSDPTALANKRKKVAFVELQSVQDFEKVLKWNDLYLGAGLGKILVNVGNFADFKTYNDLNQKLSESDDPSISVVHKRGRRFSNEDPSVPSNGFHRPQQSRFYHKSPEVTHRPLHSDQVPSHFPQQPSNQAPHELPPIIEPKPATPPKKSNPFGSAKPVDVFSKQMEIEKKLHDLEINKTTFRTLGHDEEKPTKEEKTTKTEDITTSQPKPTTSGTVSTSTPPTRSKQSTPSHHHLKLSQPDSPKKTELRPAIKPEIEAWKPLPSRSARPSTTETAPPPSNPTQLHPSDPVPVSANFFHSSKNKESGSQSTDDIPKRKVLLKRKTTEHPKKTAETSHIVRRDSNIEKNIEAATPVVEEAKLAPEIQQESAIDDPEDIAKPMKPQPQRKRSSKSPNGSNKETTNPDVEGTPIVKADSQKPKGKNFTRTEPTLNRFGKKVFHNATYVKGEDQVAGKTSGDLEDKHVVTNEKLEEKPDGSVEIPVTESFEASSLRGRGHGRRGRGRGRGRGRAGAPFRARREDTEGSGSRSKSRSKSPVKKSTSTNALQPSQDDAKPKDTNSSESKQEDAKPDTGSETIEGGSSRRSYRGRGGYRGNRGGGSYRARRGKDGLFHNVSRTFSNTKEKPVSEKEP